MPESSVAKSLSSCFDKDKKIIRTVYIKKTIIFEMLMTIKIM